MLNMKKGGRGNRKRNMIPGFLLVLLFVFTKSFSAMAAQEDKIFLVGGLDGDGEVISMVTAFVVNDGSEDYVMTDASIFNDKAVLYALADTAGNAYIVEDAQIAFPDYNVVLFTFQSERPEASKILQLTGAVKNQMVELVYVNQNDSVDICEVRLLEAEQGVPDIITVMSGETDGDAPNPMSYPGGFFDANGGLVGLYTSTGDIVSFNTDVNAFYGQSSGDGNETEGSRETQPARETQPERETQPAREKETSGTKSPGRERTGSGGSGEEKTTAYKVGYIFGAVFSVVAVIGIIYLVFRKKFKGKQQPVQQYQATPPPAPRPQQPTPPQPITPQPPSGFADYTPTAPYTTPSPAAPPRPQAMGGSLMGIGGVMSGRTYPIASQETVIGRDVSCGIRFPADTKGISRNHCKVFRNGGTGQFMLMDCNSTYGTYLKGYGKLQPQKPVALKNGDAFYLGSDQNGFTIKY